LVLCISLSTQSGNFWIHPRIVREYKRGWSPCGTIESEDPVECCLPIWYLPACVYAPFPSPAEVKSSEMSASYHIYTRHHNTEDHDLNSIVRTRKHTESPLPIQGFIKNTTQCKCSQYRTRWSHTHTRSTRSLKLATARHTTVQVTKLLL